MVICMVSEDYRFMEDVYRFLKNHERELTYLLCFMVGFMVGILAALQIGVIRYEAVEHYGNIAVDNVPENLLPEGDPVP